MSDGSSDALRPLRQSRSLRRSLAKLTATSWKWLPVATRVAFGERFHCSAGCGGRASRHDLQDSASPKQSHLHERWPSRTTGSSSEDTPSFQDWPCQEEKKRRSEMLRTSCMAMGSRAAVCSCTAMNELKDCSAEGACGHINLAIACWFSNKPHPSNDKITTCGRATRSRPVAEH